MMNMRELVVRRRENEERRKSRKQSSLDSWSKVRTMMMVVNNIKTVAVDADVVVAEAEAVVVDVEEDVEEDAEEDAVEDDEMNKEIIKTLSKVNNRKALTNLTNNNNRK